MSLEMIEPIAHTAVIDSSIEDEIVLSVQNISKRFCRNLKRSMFYAMTDIGEELLGLRSDCKTLRKHEFWSLQDVSFNLKKGEAIGLIGANGAGKTTLLKIISGLIKPDQGTVQSRGRVAPMIALGAGFNPILSGRENIFVNMTILGLTPRQIEERYDQVVDFAEIRHAIDAPVQTYSSGMSARLGFSCAIHTSPDILLIDEVLAVGDMKFRTKCYRKLAELRAAGTSFVMVSHSANTIIQSCTSGIYLKAGQVKFHGTAIDVMDFYERDLNETSSAVFDGRYLSQTEDLTREINIKKVFFKNSSGQIVSHLIAGNAHDLCIEVSSKTNINSLNVNCIVREFGGDQDIILTLSSIQQMETLRLENGQNTIVFRMPYCGLRPGNYDMKMNIREGYLKSLDFVESFKFTVVSSTRSSGKSVFFQDGNWSVE
jgi:lipopolysaccharide transport system ATP-binding protein